VADSTTVSEATVYRLSLYHCWLGELLRTDKTGRVTSRELSEQLGVKEETVRRDLSFVGGSGRPGSGYVALTLFQAIQEFLGLYDAYPIVRIGSAQMLESLAVVFPPDAYGVVPVGYFSELPEDVGRTVNGIPVKHLTDLPELDPSLGVSVAMVACSPSWVPLTLELLEKAGITGVLLLTPQIRLKKPESMNIIHVRMPCDIKSLACQCHRTGVAKTTTGVLPAIGDVQSR
jgi:redox-sensing transcriptional repressor